MDENNLDQFTFPLDENEELNALVLTNLLNTGVEEALSKLSPAELIQLEKNVQKLKRQKGSSGAGPGRPPKAASTSTKKRRHDDHDDELEDLYDSTRPRPSGGQYMNLPASAPQSEFRDGIEWLHFTYSTKGHEQEYCIRVDIEDLHLDEIPEDFKADNCVYPRALVPRESYTGNRWEYETSVNDVSWKLTWRNPSILCGKRGLIQRAVDSYRNRTSENRSRRVMRQQKLQAQGLPPRRRENSDLHASVAPKSLTIPYTDKDGVHQKAKIRVDIETVNLSEIDDDFRRSNCLYPQALAMDRDAYVAADGNLQRWEYENACNELGWRLAYLNAQKIAGRRNLLQKAVDAYQTRIEASERARRSMRRPNAAAQAAAYAQAAYDQQAAHAAAAAMAGYHQQHIPGMPPMLIPEHFDEAAAAAYYGGAKPEDFNQMVASTLHQALAEQGASYLHHHQMQMHPGMSYGMHATLGLGQDEDEDDLQHHHHHGLSPADLLGPH